jgi:hypothetical protein
LRYIARLSSDSFVIMISSSRNMRTIQRMMDFWHLTRELLATEYDSNDQDQQKNKGENRELLCSTA